MKFLTMLKYPSLSGIVVPFKVWHNSGIKICKGAKVALGGRITLGNPDRHSAIVSRLPVNIYFGRESEV
jgi:hypothetical protein